MNLGRDRTLGSWDLRRNRRHKGINKYTVQNPLKYTKSNNKEVQ